MYGKRLNTKADREKVRDYTFQALQKEGYIVENYKDVSIFYHPSELLLKTYHGTSANHTLFIKFRTVERLNEKIKDVKHLADLREKWKAEQKEKNKGKMSSQAAAAAAIRAELKTAFPYCKFSVTSESFSMGNSVNIGWTDGPTSKQVKAISGKYQYGSFNGMEDIYEYTNSREDIPQSKYVSESRTLSDGIVQQVTEGLKALKQYTADDLVDYRNNPTQEARQLLYITEIPHNYTGLQVVADYDKNRNEPFKIVFETPEPEPTKKAEVKPGIVQIIAHPIRAGKVLVIGETYALKDVLKSAGGWWNKWEKGWEFKADKVEDIKAALLAAKGAKEPESQPIEPPQPEPEQIPKPQPEPPTVNTFPEIIPTPADAPPFKYFKILWHEGRHIPGATFENATFQNWNEVQKAFTILWDVNEKGQNGGYTKVKVEMMLKGEAPQTFRIDITDKEFNGDFNPSLQHITNYLTDDMEMSESDEAMRNALLY